MTAEQEEGAITLLKDAYAAFNRNDIPAAVSGLDPAIDWEEPKEFPGGGHYHGTKEVAAYLSSSRAQWAEGASRPEQFVVHGDRIAVLVHAHFRLHGSQSWMDVNLADVYTFQNGIPVRMRAFADRKAALAWTEAGD